MKISFTYAHNCLMDSIPAYVSCCYACLLHSSVALGSFSCTIISINIFVSCIYTVSYCCFAVLGIAKVGFGGWEEGVRCSGVQLKHCRMGL